MSDAPIPFPAAPEALPTITPGMPVPMATPFCSPEIVAARAKNARRRAAAMCVDTDIVLGIELRALCPATHSMLVTKGNAFLRGSRPTPGDVRDYVWFHHPTFRPDDEPGRRVVMKQLERAAFRSSGLPWWRCRTGDRLAHGYAVAIQAIEESVESTFADAPAPRDDDRDNTPIGACLEAQTIHTFSKAYPSWPVEYIRWQPLRKLYQYLRTMRAERGSDDMDREEARLMVAHLRAMQAQADAERKAS